MGVPSATAHVLVFTDRLRYRNRALPPTYLRWPSATNTPRRWPPGTAQRGRMFLLWWKASSGSYLGLHLGESVEVIAVGISNGLVSSSASSIMLRPDRLPDRRVVIRFDFTHRQRPERYWLLIEHGDIEICKTCPGLEDRRRSQRAHARLWRLMRDAPRRGCIQMGLLLGRPQS